jgi:hypothetical protein
MNAKGSWYTFWQLKQWNYNQVQKLLCHGYKKGGSITVPLTSCLTGLDESVLQIKTKVVSCHTAHSKPVKQEVNSTVILPPLVFPGINIIMRLSGVH